MDPDIYRNRNLGPDDSSHDFFYYDSIRQAANVSKSFRKELGDALWERSSIYLDVHGIEPTFEGFQTFLENRPAVCP